MRHAPRRTLMAAGAAASLLVIAPGSAVAGVPAKTGTSSVDTSAALERALAANAPVRDPAAGQTWDPADVVTVDLGTRPAASPAGTHAATAAGTGNVFTILSAGSYRFTGTVPDGRIVVDTADQGTVRIILDNADITSLSGAPIEVVAADEVLLELADKSTNVISDSAPADQTTKPRTPAEDTAARTAAEDTAARTAGSATLAADATASLFSAADLTIGGTGALTVNSRDDSGIIGEDGLVILSGTVVVKAKKDGIKGDDYVVVKNASVVVTAGKDGLKATNDTNPAMGYVSVAAGSVRVSAGGDGIKAKTDVIVAGGRISVNSGGGSGVTIGEDDSARGINAGVSVVIGAGQISIDSADIAIHSKGTITIAAGTVSVKASVGSEADGIHADAALAITGGTVTVAAAYEGIEAVKVTITGGTVTVTSSNDGINAAEHDLDEDDIAPNAALTIRGGKVTVTSTGDDGIDSNGTIVISGGEVVVNPLMDGVDTNGTFTLAGGTVVVNGSPTSDNFEDGVGAVDGLILTAGTLISAAASASSTRPTPASAQGFASFKLDASQPAGTVMQLVSAGTVVAGYKSSKAYQSVLFSSNKILNGQSYDVYLGGGVSGTAIGGMYPAGDLSGATRIATVVAGRFVETTKPRVPAPR